MNFVTDNNHHSFASIIAMPSVSAPVCEYRGSEKDWFSSASCIGDDYEGF